MKIISIHIPKTGGTSFYHILQQVYGANLSISYKRRDIIPLLQNGVFHPPHLSPTTPVLHGHFYYSEIAKMHQRTDARIICWLRDPIDRLISNYYFFRAGLLNPSRNPLLYTKNKHRIQETLLEFAQRPENRNRMSTFLAGLALDQLFFWGFQEDFESDIRCLGAMLKWPTIKMPHLNRREDTDRKIASSLRSQLEMLNQQDIELYQKLRKRERK
ncbi:MAG: sulfotransferase family 2 domain-containing protein [Bacteroidota bacterium]